MCKMAAEVCKLVCGIWQYFSVEFGNIFQRKPAGGSNDTPCKRNTAVTLGNYTTAELSMPLNCAKFPFERIASEGRVIDTSQGVNLVAATHAADNVPGSTAEHLPPSRKQDTTITAKYRKQLSVICINFVSRTK